MKRLLSFLAILAITTVSSINVIACRTIDSAINLNSVLIKPNLGHIVVGNIGLAPSDNIIKNALKKSNSMIEIDAIELVNKTRTEATVKPKGNLYKGSDIKITFTLIVTHNLIHDIKLQDLGNIGVDNPMEKPSKELIKKYIFNRNPDAILEGFTIENITLTEATLVSDNNIYAGENLKIEFTLVLAGTVPLSTVLVNNNFDIGYIGNKPLPTEKEIIGKTIDNNPSLSEDDIYVENISVNGATVFGQGQYNDKVDIIYTVSSFISNSTQIPNPELITDLITNENNVYVGTTSGNIYESINGINPFLLLGNLGASITSMTFSFNQDLYIGTSTGEVYYYEMFFNHFIFISSVGIHHKPVIKLAAENSYLVFAIASGEDTVFYSDNHDPFDAIPINPLVNQKITDLAIDWINRCVYVVTEKDLLFRSIRSAPFELVADNVTRVETFDSWYCAITKTNLVHVNDFSSNNPIVITGLSSGMIIENIIFNMETENVYIGTTSGNIYKSEHFQPFQLMDSFVDPLLPRVQLFLGSEERNEILYTVSFDTIYRSDSIV